MAHELWHFTTQDRLLRFVACVLGGSLPALFALYSLRTFGPATFGTLLVVATSAVGLPFVQSALLDYSERKADKHAVVLLGKFETLRKAREKIKDAAASGKTSQVYIIEFDNSVYPPRPKM